jgi:GAF domain-containing protein
MAGPADCPIIHRIPRMHFKERHESVRENCLAPPQLTILTIGLARPLDDALLQAFRVVEAAGAEDALRHLKQEETAVLVLGSRLAPNDALNILTRHSSDSPGNSTAAVLLWAGCDPELFQPAVNEGHIFYMARAEITGDQLRSIILCGAARFRSRLKGHQDPLTAFARIDQLLDFCIRLPMQVDLPSSAALLTETVRTLMNAELVQYLVYDAEDEILAPADALDNKEWSESAAAGLAAFVARTGEPIRLDCIGLDPRYDFEADNPGGPEDARFLAVPLIGTNGLPAGVITATRSGKSGPFSEEDTRLLDLLAECAAPTFNQITLQNRVQALLLKRAEGSESRSDVFREEALEYHIRSWDHQGDVLQTLPTWLRTTYWAMLALVIVGLLGTVVSKLNVYASGPAVVRPHAAMKVIAADAGQVRSIAVSPGDTVRAGDVLVVIDSTIRSRTAAADSEALRASSNGIVGNVDVRPGQSLKAGDQVMSIVESSSGYDVIAFLPYSYAVELHQGMAMRLTMPGESISGHTVPISRVGPEVLDPTEAAQYAGKSDAATFPVAGRVILVRASLPVVSSDRSASLYRDGVTGKAEIRVSSESAIVALIPGLRKIFGKAD